MDAQKGGDFLSRSSPATLRTAGRRPYIGLWHQTSNPCDKPQILWKIIKPNNICNAYDKNLNPIFYSLKWTEGLRDGDLYIMNLDHNWDSFNTLSFPYVKHNVN